LVPPLSASSIGAKQSANEGSLPDPPLPADIPALPIPDEPATALKPPLPLDPPALANLGEVPALEPPSPLDPTAFPIMDEPFPAPGRPLPADGGAAAVPALPATFCPVFPELEQAVIAATQNASVIAPHLVE
jgi:hypothetical protein